MIQNDSLPSYSPASQLHQPTNQPGYLVFSVLNVWATVSNLLVFVVTYRSPYLKRSFGGVILSLSLVDLLMSLLITPVATYYYYKCAVWYFGVPSCIIWLTLNVLLVTTSVSHHCSIAINRYLAVVRPRQQSLLFPSISNRLFYRVVIPSWSTGMVCATIFGVHSALRPGAVVLNESCSVFDRSSVIYVSITCLVPLAVTFLANVAAIMRLRRRLVKREISQRISLTKATATVTGVSTQSLANTSQMGLTVHNLQVPSESVVSEEEKSTTKLSCCLCRKMATFIDLYLIHAHDNYLHPSGSSGPIKRRFTFKKSLRRNGTASAGHLHRRQVTSPSVAEPPKYLSVPSLEISPYLDESEDDSPAFSYSGLGNLSVPSMAVNMGSISENDIEIVDYEEPTSPNRITLKKTKTRTFQSPTFTSLNSIMFADEYPSIQNDLKLLAIDDNLAASYSSQKNKQFLWSANRKRAFSIDFPLQQIFAQKAPLAKFESQISLSDITKNIPLIKTDQRDMSLVNFLHHSGEKRARANSHFGQKPKMSTVRTLKVSSPVEPVHEEVVHPSGQDSMHLDVCPVQPILFRTASLQPRQSKGKGTGREQIKVTLVRNPAAVTPGEEKISTVIRSATNSIRRRSSKVAKRSNASIRRFLKRERQVERALIFILVFLFCLWLPFFVTNLLYGLCPDCVAESIHNFFHIFSIASTSAINPLVYILASRDFKKSVAEFFRFRKSTQEQSQHLRSTL